MRGVDGSQEPQKSGGTRGPWPDSSATLIAKKLATNSAASTQRRSRCPSVSMARARLSKRPAYSEVSRLGWILAAPLRQLRSRPQMTVVFLICRSSCGIACSGLQGLQQTLARRRRPLLFALAQLRQQRLYLRPLPQGHSALAPTLGEPARGLSCVGPRCDLSLACSGCLRSSTTRFQRA
jgi:hypothetical protein